MSAPSEQPRRGRAGPLDSRLKTAIAAVGCVGALMSVAALFVFGLRTGLSVAVGGGIATANLWALARIIAALLPSESETAQAQSRAAWVLLALLKLLGLIAAVWLLMRQGVVSPLAMVVGFGALPIGIAIGSLVSDTRGPSE